MVMDKDARSLVQDLIEALAPLVRTGLTEKERQTDDACPFGVSATHGHMRKANAASAAARAALLISAPAPAAPAPAAPPPTAT